MQKLPRMQTTTLTSWKGAAADLKVLTDTGFSWEMWKVRCAWTWVG